MARTAFLFRIGMIVVGWAMMAGDAQAQDSTTGPFAAFQDDPQLPRVLLLGDSISIGYTVPVRQMLAGRANVHRASENCGPTTNGLLKLDQWLGDKPWDAIHFNFGLHDLKHIDDQGNLVDVSSGRQQVPVDQYRQNLRRIVQRLQATGAKLIWCPTTPVPVGARGRVVGDAGIYNQIAEEVMQELGNGRIGTDDLFAYAKARLPELQQPANVHFTLEGSRQLAQQVVASISQALLLPPLTPNVARGRVFHDRNGDRRYDAGDVPLSGIRVSNGRQIVETANDGMYELPVTDDTTLFMMKPRGWRTPVDDKQLPQFFYVHKPFGSPMFSYAGVAPTGGLPESIDFPLYPQDEPETFQAILFGDPQPRNQQEVDYITHDVIEELLGTDASFGVTLGDIAFDQLDVMEPQAKAIALLGIPWYNVIGNHDLNYDAQNDKLSDETFERVFGPAYYSFDYGTVHFVVVDDVEWFIDTADGKAKYRGGLGSEQLEFLRADLAAIPDQQLVVLLMHIPLTDVNDRQELYRLIEKRPFSLSVSAHTHMHEHRFITRDDGWMGPEPHHHLINVTVSGSWWSGAKDERGIPHTTMADGAPNGYSILSFDGHEYRLRFKAAGRPADYQMNIICPEEIAMGQLTETPVFVNVFDGSARSTVELRIGNSREWKRLDRVVELDPLYEHVAGLEANVLLKTQTDADRTEPWRKIRDPQLSTHLWRGTLPANLAVGTHLIEVRATDMHGQVVTGKRIVRVAGG